MRLLHGVILALLCCLLVSSYAGAEEIKNLGNMIKFIKTLPDGREVRVYKQGHIEAKKRSEVCDENWVGDWQIDQYYVALNQPGSQDAEVISKIGNGYPLLGGFPEEAKTVYILDVAFNQNSGYLMVNHCAGIDLIEFKHDNANGWKNRPGTIRIHLTITAGSAKKVSGKALGDNKYEVILPDGYREVWSVVDITDDNGQQQPGSKEQIADLGKIKKAVRLSREKMVDENAKE